jgi:FKBP-type peptidyl-prolyl cis-trans isomerase
MKYKNLYLGFVFLAMLGITASFFILNSNKQNENNKEPVDIPLSTQNNLLGESKSSNQSQADQLTQSNSGGLAVQDSGVRGQQYSQNQLPQPSQFSTYEQYANSETPLYIDAVIGQGEEVKNGDNVAIFYKGYLTNGGLFDQSRPDESGQVQPFVYQVGAGQVIPGWEATIPGMKVGGQRRLIIPSQFGYGPSGQGSIPANSMLIFDVELVDINN